MARRSWCWFAVAALLIAGISSCRAAEVGDSDEYDDEHRAHIIAHKAVVATLEPGLTYPVIVESRNCTVEVVLHNAGSGTASDVVLVDVLPPGAQLIDGSLSVSFPKISSGSEARHKYVIRFTSGGSMEATFLPQGTVSYQSDTDGTSQVGKTTKAGIFLLSPVQQITRYALYAGTWASLGICRTVGHWRNMAIFLGLVGGLLGVNSGIKQFGSTRTNTRRKKALMELEKEE